MHEHPAGPASMPRCALARPSARMAVRVRPYCGRPAGRVAGPSWSCRSARLPYRGRVRAPCLRPRAPCCSPSSAVSWDGCVVLQHSPAFCLCLLSQYFELYCDTVPASSAPPGTTILQYNCQSTSNIAIHLSPRLQYNSNPLHIKLQYNPSYCKILPALQAFLSAIQKMVLQYKFFFHYNFSSPISCNTIARLAIQLQGLQYNFFFSYII